MESEADGRRLSPGKGLWSYTRHMNVHFSSKSDEWTTPQDFFDALNREFLFNLDPCATPESAKCKRFFTKEDDGLARSWKGKRVFCNPPYGRAIGAWVEKCARGGGNRSRRAPAGPYGHALVSSVYLRQGSGGTLPQRAPQVRRPGEFCSIPEHGRRLV